MRSVQDGKVYISLDDDYSDQASGEVHWSGSCQFPDDADIEDGPTFSDAGDAVAWWRTRGAKDIYIRLDDNEYLWAGEGTPPEDWAGRRIFDWDDPRGRLDGVRKTSEERRRDQIKRTNEVQATAAIGQGHRLSMRRESAGLSIDELANRLGVSPQWLCEVESGAATFEVSMSQWIQMVWATHPGWTEARSTIQTPDAGWVARNGQFPSEAERIVSSIED